MTNDFDLGDIVGDSNSGAYRKTEERQGPPLQYVSGKIEGSLADLQTAIVTIEKVVSDSNSKDLLLLSAKSAFQQELVAFLAIQNLLSIANNPSLLQRLLALSREDFEEWLEQTRNEGSVTG